VRSIICDNASFHKAKWLTEWLSAQGSWIKLEFLPAYSPDFNPIERFWRWLKTDFTHNQCWKTKNDLKKYLVKVLYSERSGFRISRYQTVQATACTPKSKNPKTKPHGV